MGTELFRGSGVAIVTPFTDSGINFDTFRQLVEFQIAGGTDAIVVEGTTGEPSTQTATEKRDAIAFMVDQVRRARRPAARSSPIARLSARRLRVRGRSPAGTSFIWSFLSPVVKCCQYMPGLPGGRRGDRSCLKESLTFCLPIWSRP